MAENKDWIAGDYGRAVQIDTEISDISAYTTKQIAFYKPDATGRGYTLHSTETATNPSGGIVAFTVEEADADANLLKAPTGVWKAIPILSHATAKLTGAIPMLINVKDAGKD
jgi:hypothetical protein